MVTTALSLCFSPTSPTEATRLDLTSLVAMKSFIEDKITEETERAQQEEVERVSTVVTVREAVDSDDDATDDASPPISPESTTTTGSASDDSALFNERPAVSDRGRGSDGRSYFSGFLFSHWTRRRAISPNVLGTGIELLSRD